MAKSTARSKQVFDAPNLYKKNQKFLWSGVLFLVLGAALVFGVFMYFYLDGAYDRPEPGLYPMMPLVLLFIPGYGYSLFRQALIERKLFKRSDLHGLLIDDKGIGGPMLLLEGVFRERLRKARKPEFYVLWESVSQFVVEPVRGSKKYGSPPYYKLCFEGKGEGTDTSCFILRQYFEASEKEIVKLVKAKLGKDKVILNDALYGDKE